MEILVMDPSTYGTPLREYVLPAAALGTAELREEEKPSPPILVYYGASVLALQLQQMVSQMQAMQQLLLNQQEARQRDRKKQVAALQDLHNRSQHLEQLVSQNSTLPNLPEVALQLADALTAAESQLVPVLAPPAVPDTPSMSSGIKLDLLQPFTGKNQDVDDWLDRKDLYFPTKMRLPAMQRVPGAVFFLRDAASKWLREMLRFSGQNLGQTTQERFHEEFKKAFRPPEFEFIARDRLRRVKHQSEVACYTVTL